MKAPLNSYTDHSIDERHLNEKMVRIILKPIVFYIGHIALHYRHTQAAINSRKGNKAIEKHLKR